MNVRSAGLVMSVLLAFSLTAAPRFIDVSKVDSRYFAHDDGRTFVPVGCNICFDRLERPSAEARALFDGWMAKFAANGGNFMRVWLSCPFVETMPDKAGEFSQEATDNLKWLVARAERLNLRLKFTFENFRRVAPVRTDRDPEKGVISFTRPVYAPYAKDIRAFFESDECFRFYVARAKHVADAVGNSPALVAVELWNEFTSTGVALPVLSAWSQKMMPEVQRLFPRQMVLQNLGSFSEASSDVDYDWLAGVKGNAYMQAHRYLDPGAPMDIVRGPVDVFCADAVRELLDRRPDLPAILAEVGAVQPRHAGPSRFYDLDTAGALIHDEIFAPFFAGGAGCGQPWHWDHQYIDRHNLWWHFARFAKAVEGLDPAAEHFRPFRTETARLRFYGLRGRTTTIVWCRDKQNDWRHEFADGLVPEALTGQKAPFTSDSGFRVYLPWEDREVTLPAGRCTLPSFKRSCVIRFTRPAAAKVPQPSLAGVTWETFSDYCHSNVREVRQPVRGIIIEHPWLGQQNMGYRDEEIEKRASASGIVYFHPYANPWSWMNDAEVALEDRLVDCLIEHFGLPRNVPVVSIGRSMGGHGALVYPRYSRQNVVAVAACFPPTDLAYHFTERPDLPRTIASAYCDQPDLADAIAAHSPVALIDELPDIPYFVCQSDADKAVNKERHGDRFAEAAKKRRGGPLRLDYVVSRGTGHNQFTPEARAAFLTAVFAPFAEKR